MRRARGVVGVVGAIGMLACALVLPGCVADPPDVVPTAEPTVRPVFATDAEALAAAKQAYEAYLVVSDKIGNEGGRDPERIAPYVTEKWLPSEVRPFDKLRDARLHFIGSTVLTHFSVQSLFTDSYGITKVDAYVCTDVSKSRLLNREGKDVTPRDRPPLLPVQVNFVSHAKRSNQLVISGSTTWSGDDFC